jgi:SAM-dependent methyltransferase
VDEYKPEAYGETWAEVYDEYYADSPGNAQVQPMVTTLAELAHNGPALELGIGTGLVALPLVEAGVEVHGIEASPAMIAKMMDKKGAGAISVTQGDFADVPVDGQYPLVFVVFNTFYCLLNQEDQVRCFRNVASRLTDGGVFVVSAFVPDMSKFNRGQSVEARRVEEDQVTLEVNRHNSVTQLVSSQSMTISNQGTKFLPVQIRYVWPSELDLMAQLAGMHLRERWGDWEKAPFTPQSWLHVSVYEMA